MKFETATPTASLSAASAWRFFSIWFPAIFFLPWAIQGNEPPAVSFRNDILPILTKAGCSGGSCHAKSEGQNGFALTVFSYDPKADYREIVFNARGRRIFPAAPENSLLLLKATNEMPHEGEKRFDKDSEFYRTIRRWIAEGAPWSVPGEPALEEIQVSPPDASYGKGQSKPLKVKAQYSDGSNRDVTALCEYRSNEEAFARVDHHGVITAGKVPGEGVVIVRYLDKVGNARVRIPPDKVLPDSAYANLPVNNEIDRYARERFKKTGLLPNQACSDSEFVRRVTLDVLGRLPTSERAQQFLKDNSPGKRDKYIDELLGEENRGSYSDFWATKWGDLLRPNTQRVGVKPVYLLDGWIREKLYNNTSWDQLVGELLTATGSSHLYGPVAVWRDKREPADMAEFVSQLFLGVRLNCARCHHHPSEKWGQDDYYGMAAFFSSMKRKGQGISPPISGEPEYWWFQPGGKVSHPVTGEVMIPKAPGGPQFKDIPAEEDPRRVFVSWLTAPDNPFFAKAMANRVWAELFGRGIVHPADDFRESNPPVNDALLDWLAGRFVSLGFDQKKLMRIILRSRLYQQSSFPNESNAGDIRNFSRSYRRRLPAEVMLDSISRIAGSFDTMDGLPRDSPSMRQWNHKMRSDFLDAFGRPDSSAAPPCERDASGSVTRALHLMNSNAFQKKLKTSEWVDSLESMKDDELLDEIYLSLLSRFPGPQEKEISIRYLGKENQKRREAVEDIVWSLVNSAEFVFNH